MSEKVAINKGEEWGKSMYWGVAAMYEVYNVKCIGKKEQKPHFEKREMVWSLQQS